MTGDYMAPEIAILGLGIHLTPRYAHYALPEGISGLAGLTTTVRVSG